MVSYYFVFSVNFDSEDDVEKVPDYIGKAIPWFYVMILLDWLVGWWRQKLSFEVVKINLTILLNL